MRKRPARLLEPDAVFRNRQRKQHARAFRFAARVGRVVAGSCVRHLPVRSDTARALDMLLQQAWKAHSGVCVLAERAFMEDAAVLSRRLLELAVQAAYIVAPHESDQQLDRARRFLAKLWISAPPEFKRLLDADRVSEWERRFDAWRGTLPEKPKHWWPSFQALFAAIGSVAAYEEDYRGLSAMAHGMPCFLAFDYAGEDVQNYTVMSASPILIHSSRYLLGTAYCWNKVFHLIDRSILDELMADMERERGLTRRACR